MMRIWPILLMTRLFNFFFSFADLMRSSFIPLFTYFNRNEKYLAIHSTWNHLLPDSLFHMKHRVGAVVIYDAESDEFLKQVKSSFFFCLFKRCCAQISWSFRKK